MKRCLWILTTLLMMGFAASGCNATGDGIPIFGNRIEGSGSRSEEVRSFDGLRGVHLATIGELRVELGDRDELTISTDDNLLEYFETEVRDGILRIDVRDGTSLHTKSDVRFHLVIRTLESVRASSSGDILIKRFDAPEVDITLSSSGDVHVREGKGERVRMNLSSSGDLEMQTLIARELTAELSSSGDVDIKRGRVEEQEVAISSSGDYDAPGLESRIATVRISSSGDAHLWVTERLRAATSSSGSIYYRGDPQSVQAKESSSGDVVRMD